MSTRSNICRQNADGSFDAIYCHFDGYPSHNGRILYENFQSPEKIAALLALGDLSVLGKVIGEKHAFESRHQDWCKAYGRDRGEEGTQAQHLADYDALSAMLEKSWTEWVYIYRMADRKWYYTNNPSPTWFKCCGEQRQTELLTPEAWEGDSEERKAQHTYLFDAKLFTALRITGSNQRDARRILAKLLDCATINCGPLPDGSPLTGEASLDGELDLIEVDGEPPSWAP